MYEAFLTDRVSLIRKNGNRIDAIPASVQGDRIFVGDTSLQMEQGDTLIRKLSNGIEEEYLILYTKYYEHKLLGYIEIDVRKETKIQVPANTNVANTDHVHAANLEEKGRVFIVHGRDDSTKMIIAQFLKELGLEPIILHEQPNKSRTIIEKFEDHSSNVKYAVILLTPDDLGGLKSEPNGQSPRARQNVVFEMGYFFGSLRRGRVCALLSPDVERPSDIDGILYIPLDETDEWKNRLFGELKAAGLKVEQEDSSSETEIDLVAGGTGLSDSSGRIRPL
jgi:predicted nucleotide-binding protein